MLFEVLATVPTNLFEPYLLISHFYELKVTLWPWSHIWLTLRILCFISSTSRTFCAFSFLFPIQTVPSSMILVELSFSKEIDPFLSFRNVRNLSLSHVMCSEHPLSTYQLCFFCLAFRAIVLSYSCHFLRFLSMTVVILLRFFMRDCHSAILATCPKFLHL